MFVVTPNLSSSFWRVLAVCAGLLAVAACEPEESPFGSSTGVISVELAWSGALPASPGSSKVLTNDLGYRVTLDAMMVNTYSVELIPCDEELFRKLQEPRQRPAVSSLLVKTAWAGHGDPTRPTRTGVIRPEWPLQAVSDVFMDTLDPPDYAYCKAHYLVGRIPETVDPDLADPSLTGTSLIVSGLYTMPGEDHDEAERHPFSIRTPAAHGVLALFESESDEDGVRLRAGDRVVVTRTLATLLDGVVFDTMSDRDRARQVLRNIVDSVSLSIERES